MPYALTIFPRYDNVTMVDIHILLLFLSVVSVNIDAVGILLHV